MKMRHNVELPPKAKLAAATAVVLVVVLGAGTPAASTVAKMRHDCCVWAPVK